MDGAGGFLSPKRRSGARRARVEAASRSKVLALCIVCAALACALNVLARLARLGARLQKLDAHDSLRYSLPRPLRPLASIDTLVFAHHSEKKSISRA